MINFSIFNIPVRIEPFFWLTMALISGRLSADSKQQIFSLIIFILAGFISILVHELGHGLTAKHLGKKVHIIVLQAFGGYAQYESGYQQKPKHELAITAAGPALQIILGIAALIYLKTFPGMSLYTKDFLNCLSGISIFWALLNLLPILPLDGGRIIQTLLGPHRIRTTLTISIATGGIIALLALTSGERILAIFAGYMAYKSYQSIQQTPRY